MCSLSFLLANSKSKVTFFSLSLLFIQFSLSWVSWILTLLTPARRDTLAKAKSALGHLCRLVTGAWDDTRCFPRAQGQLFFLSEITNPQPSTINIRKYAVISP